MRRVTPYSAALVALVALLLGVAVAQASWDVGDPYKMHYPQLPDLNGWDVNFTFGRLADDWQCTATGPVSDIHFWFSMYNEYETYYMFSIYAAIHANDTSGSFAKPGDVLWERNFRIWQDPPYDHFDYEMRLYGTGPQGFYDVVWGLPYIVEPADHQNCYQANITDIEDPFIQQKDTVYWLELLVTTESGRAGWKTSASTPFGSDALFGGGYDPFNPGLYGPAVWTALPDPSVTYPEPVTYRLPGDFAFVINGDTGTVIPEPAALVVWSLLGALGLTVGWWRRGVA